MGLEDFFSHAVLNQFHWFVLLMISILAVATAAIHGAVGVAGGFLLSAALAPLIGVQAVVPVMSVGLLISHSARALLNAKNFNRAVFFTISLAAMPFLILVALVYGQLSSTFLAVLLGSVILISIPVRRWAKQRKILATKRHLAGAGMVYGGLAGASVGPGMLLAPFMMGYGLGREAFVATLAVIALVTNITRVGIFGASGLLDGGYLLLGILVGIMTIPGNWLGRTVLKRITNESHAVYLDILTVLGALNFFWLAYTN